MSVYTLPTPTPLTWYKLPLPADTVAFTFKNDSVYDFLLYFGGTTAPTFTTSPSGQAHAQVNALEYPVLYIKQVGASAYERQLNAVGAWDGNLWYMAQNNTGTLATTGTISGRTVLNIITFGPYDSVPPSGQAVTRQVDLTSQPRVINLPMTPAYANSQPISCTVGDVLIPLNVVAVTNPSFDTGCVMYVYYAEVTPGATVGYMTFSLRLFFQDATNPAVTLSTLDLLYGACALDANNVVTPWQFRPCVPYAVPLIRGSGMPANTGIIEVYLHDSLSLAAWPASITLMMDSDKVTPGQVTIPGIGGGINPSVYAAGVPKF